MRPLRKLALMHAKLFVREPTAFFGTLIFPALLIDFFGLMFGNKPGSSPNPNYGFVDLMTPAVSSITIAVLALMLIPLNTAVARERRILRRFQATPLHPSLYLVADILINFCMVLAGFIVLILNAKLLFNLRFEGSWLAIFVSFSLSALSFFMFGYMIAALSPTARVAQVVGMVLFLPMMFLSGATLPREMMPASLRSLGEFFPMTQVVELLKGALFGDPLSEHLGRIAILVSIFIASLIASAFSFRWE